MTECCGTCKWHRHEDIDDGWVCVNDRSEYCTDWTEYGDWCEDYEANKVPTMNYSPERVSWVTVKDGSDKRG